MASDWAGEVIDRIADEQCDKMPHGRCLGICEGCLRDALRETRAEAIKECIRQLGGRYGAAATKDLRMLMHSGEDSKP